MAQRKPSNSLASHASLRGRPEKSSPQNRNYFTASPVSSQESDTSSRYGTPPSTPSASTTPSTRLPTPSVKSGEDRTYKPSPHYIIVYNSDRGVPSSDDEPGPSVNRRTVKYKGKEPEVYGGSEALASIATRLSQMEDKLDELLSRERQPCHDEKNEAATNEQIQSSQIYQDLQVENERLEGELDTVRTKLAGSKQVQNQMQSFLQDLEAAKERSANEAHEWKAQAMNEYETLKDEYRWAKTNLNRTAEESIKAWDKAKDYEREHATLKQKISDLEDTNKELAGKIQVYDLENIRRKESQSDGESQTELEVEKEVETDVEPNSMASRGAETSFIDCDPNAKEEMELHGQGESESMDIQDGEQVEQGNRQDDQQQGLQDALQHDQHEVPQDKPEVRPDEPQETQQEDTQQELTEKRLEAEPHIQQTGEQEESQEELRDMQDEGQQDGATSNLEAEQQESEENVSHSEMLARVEGRLERLMSTAQEPGIGGHTEPDNIEQQEMVETSVGNDQPTLEAPAEESPPETPKVALVSTNHEPATTKPAHVASAESLRDKHRHRQGRHRHKQREAGNHHRDRGDHRDTDEKNCHRRSHHSSRLRNTDHRIQRRQQEAPATRWVRSRSWGKTHFGIRLRRLIPMLNLRLWY